ncbi:MAG TPA: hypothetical protein VHV74_10225, partial [Pseudonocardiaceae bacterium]|nr:hypothetical protein [Pseudonocardiaceae bacterium]
TQPTARLPIQAYELSERATAQEQYIEQRLIQRCVADFGFRYLPGLSAKAVDADELISREYDSRRYGVSDADAVRHYGYQLPAWTAGPDATAGKPPVVELAVLMGSGTQDGRTIPAGGCTGQADRELAADGITSGAQRAELVSQIREDGFERAQSDSRVLAVFARWSACMRAHGFHYANPFDAGADPRWRTSGKADPTQIAVAETDVSCKLSTHLVDVEVAVESAYDNADIAVNATRLAPIRESVAAKSRAIARAMTTMR